MRSPNPLALVAAVLTAHASAQVILNEIHYHPVEKPAFNTAGVPVFQGTAIQADLTDDVHEFVELHNPGANAVNLGGWRLEEGIGFIFPSGSVIPGGGYLVIAKNPARLQAVYSITGVLGPYGGTLGNNGDSIRLLTPGNATADFVAYETNFPWATSADQLGAPDDFTLLNSTPYQYKGRSLQRVSPSAPSTDPANWIAVRPASGPTTFADLPTPGAANIVTSAAPKPVVTNLSATQLSEGATIIRSNAQVKILATFSSGVALSSVEVEMFVDNVNAFDEARASIAMTPLGSNQYTATLPQQTNRSIVRYRIRADRGDGLEVVSPRADDPAVVPTGITTREPWHSYFITPTRNSSKPVYDCFVSTSGQALNDSLGSNNFPFTGLNGLQTMAYNATGNLRRVTSSSTITTSYPRELGWPGVNSTSRIWNGSVPAVFIENGRVRDVQLRFHGSRYNRRPSRKSYKLNFLDYQRYQGADSVFITDKGDSFITAHGLHQLAGLPISDVRYVDWYFNSDGVQTRLEQGEYNGDLLDLYHEKMQRLNPGSAAEETGEYYKSVGVITGGSPTSGEGPYGVGNGWQLPATGGTPGWTALQRYDYTYTLQNHAWKGAKPIKDMIDGMWAARGDTYTSPNPNLANMRAWFQANWDIDTELTSLAVGNWMCPWDDTTQNHFFWRRTNGRWVRLLWDFDGMYGTGDNTGSGSSIYLGEVGLPNSFPGNNSRGPNYVKDSFIKAFRDEYKERLWYLNNTLLDPENLQTLTYRTSGGGTNTFFNQINAQAGGFAVARFTAVNSQVSLGIFYKPTRPVHSAPANSSAVLPGANLVASPYGYNAAYTHTAAPNPSPHAKSKWEIRSSASTYDDPVFVLTSTTDLTSLPIPFGQLTFGQTYFWRVRYFDADGQPSIASNETSFSYGPVSGTAGSVTINEVMAENLTAVTNGADRPDYIELKNNTAAAIDLTGWTLTDDELAPTKFAFPAGTSIPASSDLVISCAGVSGSPGWHSGFGLSRKGQRVLLIQGTTVRDAITFGPQAPNGAIGRVIDGTGAWTLVNASPAAANTARPFSTDTSTLKINEWMAAPISGDDWFEIHNSGSEPVALGGLWLSDTPGLPKVTQIPSLSFAAPNGCVRLDADGTNHGFNSVNFRLSNGGDSISLTAADGVTLIDSISFSVQRPGVSEGHFPDASGPVTPFPLSSSPNDNNWLPAEVRINEALTNSALPLEDYVELHNPTLTTVDISHWWLSDDHFSRRKYQFPNGTMIPPGGYLVISESQFNIGPNAFSLSSLGDEIVLSSADGSGLLTGFRSQFDFSAASGDVSFGFIETAGSPEFWLLEARSPGSANSNAIIGPVLITEIHYHPPDLGGTDNTRDEFVELFNNTGVVVDLSGWCLKGGIDFIFPAGTVLNPGEYILIVGFSPADGGTLTAFRNALGVFEAAQILGPYAPKLGNDTAIVEIAEPIAPTGGVTPFVMVDRAVYTDSAPWPTSPDGTGMSLQRIRHTIIGNDPGNWSGELPTPGRTNVGPGFVDYDNDGLPNEWEDENGLDKLNSADAMLDADGDGQSNIAEYTAATDPQDGSDVLKLTIGPNLGGARFSLSFHARAGRSYVLEFKTTLEDPEWQLFQTIAPQANDTEISIPDPTNVGQRYYRARTSGQ